MNHDDNSNKKGGKVTEALKRDWEQTKNDFSDKHGKELNQDVDDTLKQSVGKEPIPGRNTPNRED
jgi:hypothetical protein